MRRSIKNPKKRELEQLEQQLEADMPDAVWNALSKLPPEAVIEIARWLMDVIVNKTVDIAMAAIPRSTPETEESEPG